MAEDTYSCTLHQAYLLASMLVSMEDLGGAIKAADHAEAVGPLIDPTLYRAKGKALSEDLRVMRILRDCRAKLIELGFGQGGRAGEADQPCR